MKKLPDETDWKAANEICSFY